MQWFEDVFEPTAKPAAEEEVMSTGALRCGFRTAFAQRGTERLIFSELPRVGCCGCRPDTLREEGWSHEEVR